MIYIEGGFMETVSIILPVYNKEKYLKCCLDSIIKQSYSNIEIIAIDDGSTDGSLQILRKYQYQYKNIKVISGKNEGVSKARNKGLELAGSYIMFIDADDYIDCKMIENMMYFMNKKQADVVRCGYLREKNTTKSFKICHQSTFLMDKSYIYNSFIDNYDFASPCMQIIKKECIEKPFDPTLTIGEDYVFNLGIYTKASKIILLSNCFYHYVYALASATTSLDLARIDRRCIDTLKVYATLYDYLPKWNLEFKEYRSRVAYRILKEINMKLLDLFKGHIQKQDIKKVIHKYYMNPIVIDSRRRVSFKDILYSNLFSIPFLLAIYYNLEYLYFMFGRIYGLLYKRRKIHI